MYQIYDFKKEIDLHLRKRIPIVIEEKSESFKNILFRLKFFQLNQKITKSHELFREEYFLFHKNSIVYVAKKIADEKFDYIEIKDGLRHLRLLKLKKIFKF